MNYGLNNKIKILISQILTAMPFHGGEYSITKKLESFRFLPTSTSWKEMDLLILLLGSSGLIGQTFSSVKTTITNVRCARMDSEGSGFLNVAKKTRTYFLRTRSHSLFQIQNLHPQTLDTFDIAGTFSWHKEEAHHGRKMVERFPEIFGSSGADYFDNGVR
jgi:hypothetical protein